MRASWSSAYCAVADSSLIGEYGEKLLFSVGDTKPVALVGRGGNGIAGGGDGRETTEALFLRFEFSESERSRNG